MEYFYIVVFLVGVFYTLVSLIISGFSGAFHSHGDFGGSGADGHAGGAHAGHIHFDVGHSGHAHGVSVEHGHMGDAGGHHGSATGDGPGLSHSVLSWFTMIFNPLVAVSFLTVFGGMGIMGLKYFKWNSIIVLLASLACGIIVATFLYNFIAKPIYRSENTSDVSREELIGIPAEVISDILENGFGTIKYTVNSIMYTAPAKHIDQKAVKQGGKVFIYKIENNVFYISEVSDILK